MQLSTSFYRIFACVALTLIFLLHVTNTIEIPFIKKLENIVYDLRLQSTMESTVDPRIIILDIDEKSLAKEGRWPWSRDKLGYLVDILFDYYHIKLLGFDIVFSEPDNSSGINFIESLEKNELSNNVQFKEVLQKLKPQLDFDRVFANSLKDRAVVMGYYFNDTNNNINPNSSLPKPLGSLDKHPDLSLNNELGYGANLAQLQQAAIHAGYFNNRSVDSDGSYRRLPLLTTFNDNIYETLSLAMYRKLLGHPKISFSYEQRLGDHARLESINIESLSIPVSEHDKNYAVALVPYRGKQGSFDYISATDILSGKISVDKLKDKIILVGTSAAGLLDLRTTPVQNLYAGVEVHANLISSMLDNSFKSKPSFMLEVELFELIFLALLIIFIYPKLSSFMVAGSLALLTVLLIGLNIYLWQSLNLDNFLATPLIFLFLLFSIQLYFGYFLENKKRNKLGKIFGQYIPSELVSDMSQSEHDFSLKGKSKEMTVLFSDVRGFTTISEKRTPDELCDLINEILTPITEVIHHRQGTIDKYIGDAVMAFWAAPLDDELHASHAIQAALEFTPVLDAINKEFQKKDWPHIDVGIGINTGVMNVGNMGSEFRMAYTVMGDAVNLGARLEGLTKQYGVRVIVSEFTKEAAPEYSYLELDRVKVKGKEKPVTIYEPIGLTENLTPENEQQMMDFQSALYFYHDQQWEFAQSVLEDLYLNNPQKRVFKLYLDRIEDYLITPPEAGWDGVYTHLTK